MGRRSIAKVAAATSASKQGTLEQLESLRSFLPAEMGFSESDLTDCLRQCGFNAQLAAERLITGEYRKRKDGKQTFFKMTASSSPGRKLSSGSSQKSKFSKPLSEIPKTSSKRKIFISKAESNAPIYKSPTTSATHNTMIDLSLDDEENSRNKLTTNPSRNAAESQTIFSPVSISDDSAGWLLCQRWISDAVCTTRRGAVDHKEVLHTEPSGPTFLRLRGRAMEGRFPDHIGRLMNPLLRENLVALSAHSLMEERNLPTGASIPVSLSVYLPDPLRFFQVFPDSSSISDTSTSMLWHEKLKGKSSKRKTSSLQEAAFDLLQWAQYGDVPDFSAEINNSSEDRPDNEGKGEELGEEDFENASDDKITELAKEFSASVASSDKTMTIPECDDPQGLKDVELRPYQKQALYWMRQREVKGLGREEQEEQLQLLAELARNNKKSSSNSSLTNSGKDDIICECGPVQVSDRAKEQSQTCEGVTNPLSHPLWQRRFLTDSKRQKSICFFVNEFMGIASYKPAAPPRPCSGGILADAMGLGKTVMLLSLILRAKQERAKESRSATLVVAKLSLLPQWEDEIKSKTNLSFSIYYGAQSSRETSVQELENVDVVLTTYGTMQAELKRKNPLLLEVKWLRVILDEGHCIRNQNTLASKACCSLDADHRWAVSGTIMMNSVQDLFGIFKFLRHEPWSLPPFWKAAISKPLLAHENAVAGEAGNESADTLQVVLTRLRRVLAPIMIRRTKDSLTRDGKLILTLPPVETKVVHVELTPTERHFYQAVLARSLEAFSGFVDAGTAAKSYLQILSMISRLRQCCDHISLTVRSRLDDEDYLEKIEGDDTGNNDDSLSAEASKKDDGGKPQEKDVLGNEFMQGLLSKLTCPSPKRKIQNSLVDESTSPSKRPRERYLQSVASSLSNAVLSQATHTDEECPICLEYTPIQAAVLTPCGHLFCRDCLVGYLRENSSKSKSEKCSDGSCPVCTKHVQSSRIVALSQSRDDPERVVSGFLTSSPPDTSIKNEPKSSFPKGPSPGSILQDAVEGRIESSKMKAVLGELDNVWELDPGSKILIFSQFLGFLDLLQPRLAAMGVPYFRLDGQMSLAKRVDVLKEFRTGAPADKKKKRGSVLLMSMNAGGEGLNLVAASSVFLVDPWWNQAKEAQCINRIVRLGQTAPICRVRSFIVRRSVEERIVELQFRKQHMADEIYQTVDRETSGGIGGAARLTMEDLQILFQS